MSAPVVHTWLPSFSSLMPGYSPCFVKFVSEFTLQRVNVKLWLLVCFHLMVKSSPTVTMSPAAGAMMGLKSVSIVMVYGPTSMSVALYTRPLTRAAGTDSIIASQDPRMIWTNTLRGKSIAKLE